MSSIQVMHITLYIDKNLNLSVGSTSLNAAVKYSCNAVCLLESPFIQAESAIKKL